MAQDEVESTAVAGDPAATGKPAAGKRSPESSRWLDGNDSHEDIPSKEQGGHPWDAFFNAPKGDPDLPKGDDGGNADDRPVDERPPRNSRGWERRGRVEWSPGAGKCPLGDERISHCLGRILRYHTERFGLQTDAAGYVSLTALLEKVEDFEGVAEADVRRVVQSSSGPRGPRFEIREPQVDADAGVVGDPEIRALYKHPQDGVKPPRSAFGDRGFPSGYGRRSGRPYGAPPWFGDPIAAAYYGRGGRPGFRNRQRLGFSHPPTDQDYEDEGDENGDAPAGPPRHKREAPQQHQATAAAGEGLAAPAPKAEAAKGSSGGSRGPDAAQTNQPAEPRAEASSASASTAASTPKQEVWERYHEPESNRAWFWNTTTEEVFYADDEESGWQRFLDSESKPWWWHEKTGRFFYEEEDEDEA